MKITAKQLRKIINEEIQRLIESTCPCGIEREDCEYHREEPFDEDQVAELAKAMSDDELLDFLDKNDPNAEHDDLSEPDGRLAIYWREAGNRGLLDPA